MHLFLEISEGMTGIEICTEGIDIRGKDRDRNTPSLLIIRGKNRDRNTLGIPIYLMEIQG